MVKREIKKMESSGQLDPQARGSGNALFLSLLLLCLLSALALAQFAVVQKNIQSANYFLSYSNLRNYAESGIELALHDLKYNLSGNGGQIGTLNWTTADDTGHDGVPGTYDEGEGDGIPTEGELNVSPVPVGPSQLGATLTVHVADTLDPEVKHLVATATSDDAFATVEVYARRASFRIPRAGAIYVDPGIAVTLNGNSILVDGNDHDLDGSAGSAPPVFGIATGIGEPPGSNQAALLAQIPSKEYDQVLGLDASPSIGESQLNFHELMETLKGLKTRTLAAGTYADQTLGDAGSNDFQVTYATGDFHFSGNSSGAGILIIEGSATFTGRFSFQGLVLVAGDVRMSGSGTEAKVLGGLMVGQSLTDDTTTTTGSGSMKVYYSSEALSRAEAAASKNYTVLFYDDN